MITEEQFVELILNYIKQYKRINEVEKTLRIPIWECDIMEYGDKLFDTIIQFSFKEYARNEIYSWLFKILYSHFSISDTNETLIENIKGFWEIVKNYRK